MIENNTLDKDYKFIGIDMSKEYCDIAKARIEFGINYIENKHKEETGIDQVSIFDIEGD